MTLINRILVAVIVGALLTPILIFYGGFAGGVSHNSDMMYGLFPYGMAIEMHTSWQTMGMLLTYTQFPLYAVLLAVVRPKWWKVVTLVIIFLVHATAARILR